MEDKLDSFVDNLFGGGSLIIINGVLGLALIVFGVILLTRKRAGVKRRKTAGIICIAAGICIILSGIVQSLTL